MGQEQLRRSQLLTTFSPGALVDFPDSAAIISGTEHWKYDSNNVPFVEEPRLLSKLMRMFPGRRLALRLPPVQIDEHGPKVGVHAFLFPQWFVVQHVTRVKGATRRRLVHKRELTKGKYLDPDSKTKQQVVPMRFVQACHKGHIDDVAWRDFIHAGGACGLQGAKNIPLWIEERGTSGALSDMKAVCQCGKDRMISEVYGGAHAIGRCTGRRPWLGRDDAPEICQDDNGKSTAAKILLRGASNAHFPQVLSVISIPDAGSVLEKAVVAQWDTLGVVTTREVLLAILQIPSIKAALEGFSDSEIWAAIQARRDGVKAQADRPVKDVEFDAFSRAPARPSRNPETPDFLIHQLDPKRWENLKATGLVEQIVLVDKLREVAAMVGFTRLAPASNEINGELNDQVEVAPIHQSPDWFPVREIRGEGIFLQFRTEAVLQWLARPRTKDRVKVMEDAFDIWHAKQGKGAIKDPGLAYYMLHSLSHLLMTSISLECGYPASSLKERIYCLDRGFGILIYTGSNDVDGTLGGLVQSGEDIERHLLHALRSAELCSGDPVCAHHEPSAKDDRPLQGAACHGCLFIPETSCEQRNEFLDRTLVVETVDRRGCEFFTAEHIAILGRQ